MVAQFSRVSIDRDVFSSDSIAQIGSPTEPVELVELISDSEIRPPIRLDRETVVGARSVRKVQMEGDRFAEVRDRGSQTPLRHDPIHVAADNGQR